MWWAAVLGVLSIVFWIAFPFVVEYIAEKNNKEDNDAQDDI